jgi:RNA polymerase sigma-70 factor (ECF subfamily)
MDFRSVWHEHKDSVYAFAFRMTNSTAAADDITQDCFLELIRHPNRFDPARGTLRIFLLGVARNVALKQWRREHRSLPMDSDLPCEPAAEAAPLDAALAVAAAVQSLPPFQREAVLLFEYEVLTLEETAAAVQADVGTVKSRLHRARENLRRALAPFRSANHGG